MIVLILAALLALVAPQAPAQNTGVIEGRVLRTGSSDPIPNVQVTLIGPPPGGATPQSSAATAALSTLIQGLIESGNRLGVGQAVIDNAVADATTQAGVALGQQNSGLTDGAGHFSFKNLAPGKYTLRASREGFFGPSVNGSPSTLAFKTVTIEADKPVPSADMFMVQGGIISGRIRDPDGQPASGVQVAANRVTYSNGRPQWSSTSSKAHIKPRPRTSPMRRRDFISIWSPSFKWAPISRAFSMSFSSRRISILILAWAVW